MLLSRACDRSSYKPPPNPPSYRPSVHLCVPRNLTTFYIAGPVPLIIMPSCAPMYIVSAVLGRAKFAAGIVRFSWPTDRIGAACACTLAAHARHTRRSGSACTAQVVAIASLSGPRIRGYTSHNVIASRSEVIGSRFGMNSWAMKPVWPVSMMARTIAGQFSSCVASSSLRPGTPPV